MSIPRTVRVPLAVLIPCLDEFEEFIEPLEASPHNVADCLPDLSFLQPVADPAVELGMHHGVIDENRDLLIGPEEVNDRALAARGCPGRVGPSGVTGTDLSCERDQPFQILLVLKSLLLPSLDQGFEQIGRASV